ncbi:LytTR family DNA-binding domain-containing protein [Chitinophagaceae bacterium LB-8]|uniref:LytTR family DNA-binding domain-containing protein n=1 Tax=Paraflavisolibacter caeni TaxID=2982496 RepID=A0A9X2XTI4_9BACT|nr:LytTR family DNA-binding domain-containing protein [Paraflavisolibacter caeni]MCU7548320.1 LytTR family DNA-binding domain-containing protein [Paraflavisolibacter caeni]
MQIKCVAIDDEPLALELLKEYIARFPFLKLVHAFDDPLAGSEFLRAHPVELLFVDINMPDISGINLVKSLSDKPIVIFTTAHKEFAHEGYELDALDYLLKPIQPERFEKAVNKVLAYFQYMQKAKANTDDALFVRSEYQLIKIGLDEIEYIESVDDYLKIHRSGARPVMTLMTLKAILEKLPDSRFKRIHRSYVVPLSKIKSLANRKVQLASAELPISDRYASFIKDWKTR